MTKRHVIDSLRGGEIRTHEATNGLTTRLMSDRRKKPQAISSFGDVEFPTDPSDGVALAHKEAIAEFPFRIGGTYAIHDAQNSFSAAVRNFEEDRAVSFSHLLGPKEIEVSGKFDLSIRVARRFVDIDNLAVVDVRWVDRKIDATHDFFVGARRTNRAAILNVRARKYFDSRNVRRSARDRDQQQESIEKRDEASAQKNHHAPPKRAQLTSLLAEANPADTDFVHRSAIESQSDAGKFGGIEPLRSVGRLKIGKRNAHALENCFPILIVALVVQNPELCKLFLEGWRNGNEAAHRSGGRHAVAGH